MELIGQITVFIIGMIITGAGVQSLYNWYEGWEVNNAEKTLAIIFTILGICLIYGTLK